MRNYLICISLAAAALVPGTARADEIFGGVYAHDVDTGITASGIEPGTDFQLGWRGERIRALSFIGAPSPHVFGQVNSSSGVNFAAAGVSWKIGGRVYLRPGVGIAIHDGPERVAPGERRIDFGSRILFEPEIGIGIQATERLSVEASWIHLSHAMLFSDTNPGIDNIGVRVNYRF